MLQSNEDAFLEEILNAPTQEREKEKFRKIKGIIRKSAATKGERIF